MVALSLGSGSACAVTEPEPQNLVFDGATLTWNTNTENKAFTNAAGESASFATGDNVTFASDATISLGEDISAGQINIASGADVVIELDDNGLNFDTLSLLGGSIDVGNSLNVSSGGTLAVGSNNSVLKSALVLESDSCLSVDYSGSGAATSLNNSSLSLQGDTQLQLSGCGNGDGKTYTLLTGVSELRDSQGNAISLEKGNNAISNYFDTTQPGTGFWANAILQLNENGDLQIVRYNEEVQDAVTITTRKTDGADYQYYARVSFVEVEHTSSYPEGGAIYGAYNRITTLSNNGSVEFWGNSAYNGGAIFGFGARCQLKNNESVAFTGNKSSSDGGAIYGGNEIEMKGNNSISFLGNSAKTYGGAIMLPSNIDCVFSDNGTIVFEDNFASYGGAIYGYHCASLELSNNASVKFINNRATPSFGNAADNGGAINLSDWSTFILQNNGEVLFEKNTVLYQGKYLLRGLCVDMPYGADNRDQINISAPKDKRIEFRDSIYINADCAFNLNIEYINENESPIPQTGDIVFTGAYTEAHLKEILAADNANRNASDEEIVSSRTSEVYAMPNLYGGRLRVEDGAIYQGQGITAHVGSNATVRVKDAVLSHADYELHFYEGTKLETLGTSEIFGDVIVESTATAAFSALTRLEGSLTLISGSTLQLDGVFTLNGTLTLGTGLTLGGNVLELLNQLQYGQSLTLVSGLDSLTVQSLNAKSTSEYSAFATDQELRAADYFSNLSPNMVLKYNGEVGSLSVSRVIPEPATATLSLLALTALMSRRRRK